MRNYSPFLRLVGCRWVYKKKIGNSTFDVEVVTYKAYFVAKRYSQKKGVDYKGIFIPILQHTCPLEFCLCLWALIDMELEWLGV